VVPIIWYRTVPYLFLALSGIRVNFKKKVILFVVGFGFNEGDETIVIQLRAFHLVRRGIGVCQVFPADNPLYLTPNALQVFQRWDFMKTRS
jgi:hypothetical protein